MKDPGEFLSSQPSVGGREPVSLELSGQEYKGQVPLPYSSTTRGVLSALGLHGTQGNLWGEDVILSNFLLPPIGTALYNSA